MNEVAWAWNPEAKPADIIDLRDKLSQLQRTLEKAADDIAHHKPKRPQLPISDADLPQLVTRVLGRAKAAFRAGLPLRR